MNCVISIYCVKKLLRESESSEDQARWGKNLAERLVGLKTDLGMMMIFDYFLLRLFIFFETKASWQVLRRRHLQE